MRVECEKCGSEFNLDDRLIRPGGTKVRCSKCSFKFKVYSDADENKPQAVDSETQTPRQTEPPLDSECPKTSPIFTIVEEQNCPLYELNDEFKLDGNIFLVPRDKAPCLILARDVKNLLEQGLLELKDDGTPSAAFYDCSGCTGNIKFQVKGAIKDTAEESEKRNETYLENIARSLQKFPIFQTLEEQTIKEFLECSKFEEFIEGDYIIKKGDPGRNLYIVISGKVEVVGDDDMSLAFIGKGEVFGEMSILSGNPVGASIKVVEPSTVQYINQKEFKRILNQSPALQMYFTRLLAGRMTEINLARSEEFSSGMSGKLSEMPPSELFQTMNLNQKTGVLTLKLSHATAYLSFREGELISVKYNEKEGEEAFFELLKLKQGRFKFSPGLTPEEMDATEVGDFMHLLMEGLRRIDEDDRRFLRTVIPALEP